VDPWRVRIQRSRSEDATVDYHRVRCVPQYHADDRHCCGVSIPAKEIVMRSINEGEVYRFLQKPWDNTQSG